MSEEGRPWDVLSHVSVGTVDVDLCAACQVVAQGQASPAFHEISTGAYRAQVPQ